jgi:hypothetical protein
MSMKEHYKRLLGEMVQTKERGEEIARQIADAENHVVSTRMGRDLLYHQLVGIGEDPNYDPNTHLGAAAEKGAQLVNAVDRHRLAVQMLARLQGRDEREKKSKQLYVLGGGVAKPPIREDLQTPARATQTTRNIRRLGREATALGDESDAIYQGIYGIHPRDAGDISSLSKMDFSKVMADPFGHDYGDSVDAYIDARMAQGRLSDRARREREHPTKIYGLGGKVVGTLKSPGKPATGVGRGKTEKDFVGKKTAKKTAKKTSTAKKPVKSFKKRLEEALLGEGSRPLRRLTGPGMRPGLSARQIDAMRPADDRKGFLKRVAMAAATAVLGGAIGTAASGMLPPPSDVDTHNAQVRSGQISMRPIGMSPQEVSATALPLPAYDQLQRTAKSR